MLIATKHTRIRANCASIRARVSLPSQLSLCLHKLHHITIKNNEKIRQNDPKWPVNIESVFAPTIRDVCVRDEQSTGTKNCSGFGLVKKWKLVVNPLNGLNLQAKILILKVCIILDWNGIYKLKCILRRANASSSFHDRTSFVLNVISQLLSILQLQSLPLSRHPHFSTFQSFHLWSKLILTAIVGGQGRARVRLVRILSRDQHKGTENLKTLERIRGIG